MPDPNKTVEDYLKTFQTQDEKRKKEPLFGNRAAENTLMELCEFLKKEGANVDADVRRRTVETLQKMNLVPYRSYCREHLLDIGVTNV